VQRRGPFLLWEHTHRLAAVAGGTELYDHVAYRLFGGPLAAPFHPLVRGWLDEIFDYRAGAVPPLLSGSGPRRG
jgi:ligand-binding SRPBCC domain-containing protein